MISTLFTRISAGLFDRLSNTAPIDEALIDRTLTGVTSNLPHARRRTLSAHLRGTREILRVWRQPMWVQLGGLFHSIYGTDQYKNNALTTSQRNDLRRLISARAERLAYLFAASRKQDIVAAASDHRAPVRLSDRLTAGHNLVSAEELFGLLILLMANKAEQTAAKDSLPGQWLADLSTLRRLLNKGTGFIPSTIETLDVSLELEAKLIAAYRSAMRILGTGDLQSASRSLDEIEQSFPQLAEPCLWRALIALQDGNYSDAKQLAGQAELRFLLWGTSWDKRLPFHDWVRVAQAIQREDVKPPEFLSSDAAYLALWATDAFGVARFGSLFEEPTGRGTTSGSSRLRAFLQCLGTTKDSTRLNVYPLLDGPSWYNPHEFAITKALEHSFPAIRDEIFALDARAFHSESEKIRRTGYWDVYMLYERGRKNVENCERCPTVTRIVEEHDTVRTLAGLIYVSRMAPQTHVAKHRGPTNMRVRCHLGISVPHGDCAIRVGPEVRGWSEGHCLIFDDYYEHEAWNHTAAERVVLIIDLWRPELTPEEREFLGGLHRYALLQAESLHRYWSANAGITTAKRKEYD